MSSIDLQCLNTQARSVELKMLANHCVVVISQLIHIPNSLPTGQPSPSPSPIQLQVPSLRETHLLSKRLYSEVAVGQRTQQSRWEPSLAKTWEVAVGPSPKRRRCVGPSIEQIQEQLARLQCHARSLEKENWYLEGRAQYLHDSRCKSEKHVVELIGKNDGLEAKLRELRREGEALPLQMLAATLHGKENTDHTRSVHQSRWEPCFILAVGFYHAMQESWFLCGNHHCTIKFVLCARTAETSGHV